MIGSFPILSALTFMPLFGALIVMLISHKDERVESANARHTGLVISILTLLVALFAMVQFDPAQADFQFVEEHAWLPSMGIHYKMGIDGISLFFIVLSALLTPLCLIMVTQSVKTRVKEYVAAFLVLETLMIGTFCAMDALLFYIFFEAVLIPMFLIIGVWGGARRVYASYKFFLFTLLGSVLMLIALIALYLKNGTTDMMTLAENPVAFDLQVWLWLAFFASFAVKMPMWPVHTWLPDAHVEAPTGGSVILAGVLLKMGGYGFLRFSLPMFPEASELFTPLVMTLSVIAIVYTSLIALVQDDMKKMIAYSSVAHMGFVTLGIFSATVEGVSGGIFQMISHGLISAALFLCVGVVYDRLHTRELARYGGLVKNMPKYATIFMLFMLGSVGLYHVAPIWAVLGGTGLILGATYMLWLYRKVVFGEAVNADASEMEDVNRREKLVLIPLALLTLWLGVFPGYVLDRVEPAVESLVSTYKERVGYDESKFALTVDPSIRVPEHHGEEHSEGTEGHH